MKLLVLDFVRRWWLMLVLVFASALLMAALGGPSLFMPVALICLLYDGQRGWMRVMRPLPVPVREQALSLWIIGVWLLPLLLLVEVPIGVLAWGSNHMRTISSPWFASGVAWWVGLGYSAFVFLLCIALPTQVPVTRWEMMKAMLVSLGWGVAMPGSMFLSQKLPKSPAELQTWHMWLMASVPLWIWLSYQASPEMARRRLSVNFARATVKVEPVIDGRQGLTGLPLLLRNLTVRHLSMLGFMLLAQALMLRWVAGEKAQYEMLGTQLPIFGMMFSAMSSEALNLRSLRMLPISTSRLAAVLLTVPVVMSVAMGLLVAIVNLLAGEHAFPFQRVSAPHPPFLVTFVALTVGLLGMSTLVQVVMLHIVSGMRLLVFVLMAMVTSLSLSLAGEATGWFFGFGVVTTVIAVALLHRGLRKSKAFYQPRRAMGFQMGQMCGQQT